MKFVYQKLFSFHFLNTFILTLDVKETNSIHPTTVFLNPSCRSKYIVMISEQITKKSVSGREGINLSIKITHYCFSRYRRERGGCRRQRQSALVQWFSNFSYFQYFCEFRFKNEQNWIFESKFAKITNCIPIWGEYCVKFPPKLTAYNHFIVLEWRFFWKSNYLSWANTFGLRTTFSVHLIVHLYRHKKNIQWDCSFTFLSVNVETYRSTHNVPHMHGGIHEPCGHGRGMGLAKCLYYCISFI